MGSYKTFDKVRSVDKQNPFSSVITFHPLPENKILKQWW